MIQPRVKVRFYMGRPIEGTVICLDDVRTNELQEYYLIDIGAAEPVSVPKVKLVQVEPLVRKEYAAYLRRPGESPKHVRDEV